MIAKILKAFEPGGRAEYRPQLPGKMKWVWLFGSLSWLGLVPSRRIIGWLSLAGWLARAGWLLYQARFRIFARRERLFQATGPADFRQILDFGSGRGVVTIGAAARWPQARLVAVDDWQAGRPGSEENLRSNLDLQGLGGRVHVFQVDPVCLPFEAGQFDLIVSQLYLHTLKEPVARRTTLMELARVLKPGGQLVLSDYHFDPADGVTLKQAGLILSSKASSVHSPNLFNSILQPDRYMIATKPVL